MGRVIFILFKEWAIEVKVICLWLYRELEDRLRLKFIVRLGIGREGGR